MVSPLLAMIDLAFISLSLPNRYPWSCPAHHREKHLADRAFSLKNEPYVPIKPHAPKTKFSPSSRASTAGRAVRFLGQNSAVPMLLNPAADHRGPSMRTRLPADL